MFFLIKKEKEKKNGGGGGETIGGMNILWSMMHFEELPDAGHGTD